MLQECMTYTSIKHMVFTVRCQGSYKDKHSPDYRRVFFRLFFASIFSCKLERQLQGELAHSCPEDAAVVPEPRYVKYAIIMAKTLRLKNRR